MGLKETLGEAFVQIRADLSDLDKDFNGVKTRFERVTADLGDNFKDAGKAMTAGFTVPLAAIGGTSIKMASDFESSFAGVLKTVSDATDSAGNITKVGEDIRQGFRDMAKEIPVNVNELNKIGEAAGQLGIKSDAIMEFTRVMADLSVTTNLSSDQAATAIAQIANVMGTSSKDFGRFGATLVALGNDGASTEAQIVEMAQRIAGAGKQIGMTEGQVLATANALASVGIDAEAGGSAISKVLINMGVAAATGSEDLEMFATAAHMSVADFKTLFEQDAAGALNKFVQGLAQTKAEGGSILKVLDDMGITEVRMRNAILSLAGSGTILNDSLILQKTAWESNTALTKEAAQRYKTFESQMTIVGNQLRDVAIELGTALLPILKDFLVASQPFISMIAALARGFSALPEPVQKVIFVVGAVVAAIGPLLYIIGSVVTTVGAAIPALTSLATAFGMGPIIATLVTAFKALLPILGPAGWILAGVIAVWTAWKNWDKIKEIVANVYNAVKTWLVDKFASIIQSIKGKIDAVTGFFANMYDAVVGHSYVPDMIEGIRDWFGKLDQFMVVPTAEAADGVVNEFREMQQETKGIMATLFEGFGDIGGQIGDSILRAIEGGGNPLKAAGGTIGNLLGENLGKSVSGFVTKNLGGTLGKVLGGTLGSIIPGLGTMLGGLLGEHLGKGLMLAGKGIAKAFKSIWGGIKSLFGGPSEKELAGREAAHGIQQKLADSLNSNQRTELADAVKGAWKGNELGAATAISLRDAFIKAGFGEREGLDWADRLWRAEKDGPEEVKKVVDAMRAILGPNMPQLATGGITKSPLSGAMAQLHGTEVVAPLDRLQSIIGEIKSDPMEMAMALRAAGLGRAIQFSPVFKGALDSEMKAWARKMWPMFLDILKESGSLRGDTQVVLGVV